MTIQTFRKQTFEDVWELVKALGKPPKGVKSVYGPGKSGSVVAELFAKLHGLEVKGYPHEADMFIEDTVLTGRQFFVLRRAFPDKPFWALVWHVGRMLPMITRDKDKKVVKRERFAMGPLEKAAVVNPKRNYYFPMRDSAPRKIDGEHIAAQMIKRDKGNETKLGAGGLPPFPKAPPDGQATESPGQLSQGDDK